MAKNIDTTITKSDRKSNSEFFESYNTLEARKRRDEEM